MFLGLTFRARFSSVASENVSSATGCVRMMIAAALRGGSVLNSFTVPS